MYILRYGHISIGGGPIIFQLFNCSTQCVERAGGEGLWDKAILLYMYIQHQPCTHSGSSLASYMKWLFSWDVHVTGYNTMPTKQYIVHWMWGVLEDLLGMMVVRATALFSMASTWWTYSGRVWEMKLSHFGPGGSWPLNSKASWPPPWEEKGGERERETKR